MFNVQLKWFVLLPHNLEINFLQNYVIHVRVFIQGGKDIATTRRLGGK